MPTHNIFHSLLDFLAIPYRLTAIADYAGDTTSSLPENSAITAILKDDAGFVIAAYPAEHQLDLQALKNTLRRQALRFLNSTELDALNSYFGSQPSNPSAHGIQFIFDEGLNTHSVVSIKLNDEHHVLELPSPDHHPLVELALFGSRFSTARSAPARAAIESSSTPNLDIRDRVTQLKTLPVMPEMALQIMGIRNNPDAAVEQLAEIISLDPGIAAQIMRYANSALFGQRGQVDSLEDAIFRVLGFDTVLHLALGVVMAKSFKLPAKGPLGQNAFWHNATYSAALMQKLSQHASASFHLKPGVAYLSGLLHNIGFLVLGSLFPSEYFWFNKVLMAKPDRVICQLEQRMLGVTHMELGTRLMQAWNMPEEITTVITEHHNPAYEGAHAAYVRLAILANQLLKTHNMSDADTDELSTTLCAQLGLEEEQLYWAMDEVLQSSEDLEGMVNSMTA